MSIYTLYYSHNITRKYPTGIASKRHCRCARAAIPCSHPTRGFRSQSIDARLPIHTSLAGLSPGPQRSISVTLCPFCCRYEAQQTPTTPAPITMTLPGGDTVITSRFYPSTRFRGRGACVFRQTPASPPPDRRCQRRVRDCGARIPALQRAAPRKPSELPPWRVAEK